jgi:hypothetical protein
MYIFQIVGKPKVLLTATGEEYDVFISYKRSRNAIQARHVADALRSKGLRVWFDVDVLNLREDEHVNRDELATYLMAAVKLSRIVVVFAAQMEALVLPPGMTKSDAILSGDSMIDETSGAIIAWNWQKLEIDSANRFVQVDADSSLDAVVALVMNNIGEPVARRQSEETIREETYTSNWRRRLATFFRGGS